MVKDAFHGRALRVAVIGAGPAGFYTAEELLRLDIRAEVDLYERLFAPYGLVRYGVAPDHQKTKLVTKRYDKLANEEGFRFIGNVEIGVDINFSTLREHYDAIVVTSGTESGGALGIPGEDRQHSHHAFEFVNWYNGHPDHQHHRFNLQTHTAVIVGNGNVAIDVARILAKSEEELRDTDIPKSVLSMLTASKIKEIRVVGRRGPVQASFTPKELKELGELAECSTWIAPEELDLNAASEAELNDGDIRTRGIVDLFNGFANAPGNGKNLRLQFHRSPIEITESGVRLVKNALQGEAGAQRAEATADVENLDAGLIISCIGYRAKAIEGLPFNDRRGVLLHDAGKVETGIYTAGWIKRGPSGLIGNNKKCAAESVKTLRTELEVLPPCPKPFRPEINKRTISYADWKRLDAEETAQGSPRKKVLSLEEAIEILDR